jgi:NAD(P)-dependent dehydrogenase (short-subunit alcohol dehydrogenase family)
LVTGGAQGIGEAIAERLARDGALVAIADCNVDSGKATAQRLSQTTGKRVMAFTCDISDRESVAAMYAQTVASLGGVDILVNNAGIAEFNEPLETDDVAWQRCMSVDLEGAWHCAKAVLPAMIEQRYGSIINIISNHAFSIIKSTFPYPVAKHGLLGLTRALAIEYADRGITVNAVSPGYVDTPIADRVFAQSPDPAKARRDTEAKQPQGRLCQPSEVAAVVSLLASDEARFIVGENIVIDGGVTIRMYE